MNHPIQFEFQALMWQHAGSGGWHFIALPEDIAHEIRNTLKWQEEGWGRLKCVAQIGQTEWRTAIWFDTKHNTYLLPIKAEVRKQARLIKDSMVNLTIKI